MAERRWVDERWREIAEGLVEREPRLAHVAGSEARIAYLSSDAEKKSRGRPVYGTCEKVPAKWQWSRPYDFAITVFEPNVAGLDERRLERLIYHELLHIGIDLDGEGRERYSVVPHDVEDFREMVERFGVDWILEEADADS